jgi:hypothetical protein
MDSRKPITRFIKGDNNNMNTQGIVFPINVRRKEERMLKCN